MAHLVEETSRALGADFDIELLELHHRGKADAPSGTAKVLMDAANAGLGASLSPVYGRRETPSGSRGKSASTPCGAAALRGNILFSSAGKGKHSAFSTPPFPGKFCRGAIRAMLYLQGCPAGLYGMESLLQF